MDARCHSLAREFFFFFQAEDGIRDLTVTGVQTCALPILSAHTLGAPRVFARCRSAPRLDGSLSCWRARVLPRRVQALSRTRRSEERRVGKECRSRGSPDHSKKKEVSLECSRCHVIDSVTN